jgi:hypothetical protein
MSKTIEVAIEVKGKTDAAIFVTDGNESAWLPKSQIENGPDSFEIGQVYEITIPEWLALKKGLI